jgi:DNA-binding MarR family transcriptional regulator
VRVRGTDDRRRVGLDLTPEGVKLLKRVKARRTTWLASRLAALDPAELEQIERALEPLRRVL